MGIYQHFRKHEHPFVDQVLSWRTQVEQTYQRVLTDFLDPREQQIVKSILGQDLDEIQYKFSGGIAHSERKRLLIVPFYEEITNDMFEIALLGTDYPSKFVTLRHRDVLGAFVSMGIERRKMGDIFVDDHTVHILLTADMSDYTRMNLTQIKNATMAFKEQPLTVELKNNDTWIHTNHIISSLRLDILIKEIYRLSRSKAVDLIREERVKVNFTDVNDPAIQVLVDDLISVRRLGRSKLVEINGRTRKDKYSVTVARLKT